MKLFTLPVHVQIQFKPSFSKISQTSQMPFHFLTIPFIFYRPILHLFKHHVEI